MWISIVSKERCNLKLSALCLLLVPLLSGCATSYQKADPNWGFFEKQLDETHYLVGFQANGFTEHSKVVAYFMYRCAELTQQSGNSYFVIADPKKPSTNPVGSPSSTVESLPSGRIQLILTPGAPSVVRAIVSLENGLPPPNDPYAFDPRELQAELEKFIKVQSEAR